ncbi:tetratricopeptide repeat protein [Cypionkella sp.]|uniref:tetratricopeptide repeat protein n=1 Tax=Cypionkella sp. TaxID=2811411 RepID=UPI002ABAA4ED|nr:tetratricopeptide repeat protein [Cypionkella sp.]MDZ4395073.1 tetratricopeptide repeat protein [Cypionkella sp.]
MPFHLPSRKQMLLASALMLLPFTALAETSTANADASEAPLTGAGAYLAAAVAASESDYAAAVEWYGRALTSDADNPALLEGAVLAHVGVGDMETAAKLARDLQATGAKSQIGTVALIADNAKREDYEAILKEQAAGGSAGAVLDELVKAWAKLGLGRMSEATEAFDKMAKTKGLEAFGLYHKALALASAGDYEGAENILSGKTAGSFPLSRRGVIATVEILSQLERNPEAVEMLDRNFSSGNDLEIDDLRRRLSAGEPLPFTIVRSASDGISEVFFSMANAVRGEADATYILLHARAAAYLRPENAEAQLLVAGLLEQQRQHDLATQAYAQVQPSDLNFHIAEIGRANASFAAGRPEAALEILQGLARAHGDILAVQVALADGMRREKRYDEAYKAYDAAVKMVEKPNARHWVLFYSRGVVSDQLRNYDAAEADFRRAMALSPNEPELLNYLGYSLVDQGRKLDEALGMIKRAVIMRPDSGAILDSLGWAYYRLGRYKEALPAMEQASLRMAVDATVTDHLGDVYWAVGRKREAEYQWHRALSYGPDDKLAARLRLKLAKGLDAVLAAEGAAPLKPLEAAAVTP